MKLIQKNTLKNVSGLAKSSISLGFVPVHVFSSSSDQKIASLYKKVVTDSFPAMEKLFINLHRTGRDSLKEDVFPLYNHWLKNNTAQVAEESFNQTAVEEEMLNYIRFLKKNFTTFKLDNIMPIFELLGVFRNSHFRSRLFINFVKFVESPEVSNHIASILADTSIHTRENFKNLLSMLTIAVESGLKNEVIESFLSALNTFEVDRELALTFTNNPYILKFRPQHCKKIFWEFVDKYLKYFQTVLANSSGAVEAEDVNSIVRFAVFYNKVGGSKVYELLDRVLECAVNNVDKIQSDSLRLLLQSFSSYSDSKEEEVRKSRLNAFDALFVNYLNRLEGVDKLGAYLTELMVKNRITQSRECFELLKVYVVEHQEVQNIRYLLHYFKFNNAYIWADGNKKTDDKLEEAYVKAVEKVKSLAQNEQSTDREYTETDVSPLLEAIGLDFTKNFHVGLISLTYKINNFAQWLNQRSTNDELKAFVSEYLQSSSDSVAGLKIHSSRSFDSKTRQPNRNYYFQKSLRNNVEIPLVVLDISHSQYRYLLKSENPDTDFENMLLKSADNWWFQHKKAEVRKIDADAKRKERYEKKRSERRVENSEKAEE